MWTWGSSKYIRAGHLSLWQFGATSRQLFKPPISSVLELGAVFYDFVRRYLLQEKVSLSEIAISERDWGAPSGGIP